MYTLIDTPEQLHEVITQKILPYNAPIGADIESTGLDCFVDDIVLLQLALGSEIFIFDIRSLGYENLTRLLASLLNKKTIFHNAQFDLKFLYNRTGIWLQDVHCTMVAEAVLNAGRDNVGLSLQDVVKKYCDMDMEKESRNEFVGLKPSMPLTESMLIYAALDTQVLLKIYEKQMEQANKARMDAVLAVESSVVPKVAKMEYTGIILDPDKWSDVESRNRAILAEKTHEFKRYVIDAVLLKLAKQNLTGLDVAEKLSIPVSTKKLKTFLAEISDISNLAGWLHEKFNPNSSNQMLAVLNMFGVKVESTGEKVIARYKDQYEIVSRLLEVREYAKSVSTYGLSWLDNIHAATGRVHTSYFTGGTDTGRFSSSSPNLQNVPSKGGFRECFVPEEGFVFVSCDYSQQEYRLAGAVSGERAIIDAYVNGYDMHIATAAKFFNKDLADVTGEERSWGKTRNFEILYGTTEWGLHKSLKSSLEYAKDILDRYWAGYPTLSAFKTMAEEKILQLGYSVTPLGRRRYVPEKPIFMDARELERWKSRVKRELFNHIIQGGGADIIKIALANIETKNPFGDKFRTLLQIHDELLFEVHDSIKHDALEFIKQEMIDAEQPFLGEIPAVVEGSIKCHWTK